MKALTAPRWRSRLAVGATAFLSAMFLAAVPAAQADTPNPTLTVNYDAVGTTHIGAQVNSTMPIGPSVLSSTMDIVTADIVNGSLAVPAQQLNFNVLGIPARATVAMSQVGPLTGLFTPTGQLGKVTLTSNVAYDIKISNVQAKVFGIWWPLAVGSNCHTIDPVSITASTPAGEYFTINDGGHLVGTYTIGNFTGCAPLNFFDIPGFFPWFGSIPVNALVPGSNNTLDLQISNPRYGGL